METVSTEDVRKSVQLLKALADPIRLRILHLLFEADEVCVCHLHEALELPQPTVSRHLAYLRKHGLVAGRKQGLWVYYRLAKPTTNLHRGIAVCLQACLGDMNELRLDVERLKKVEPCRDEF